MMRRLFLYAIGVWFILVIVAILNGAFREGFIRPRLGEYPGHVFSTVILAAIIWIVVYLFVRTVGRGESTIDFLLIGVLWLILTVIFEFCFGHYVEGQSWDMLLANYNVLNGRIWVLVLLSELIAPPVLGSVLVSS